MVVMLLFMNRLPNKKDFVGLTLMSIREADEICTGREISRVPYLPVYSSGTPSIH